MKLIVNGETRISASTTVVELVEELGLGDDLRGIALALNDQVVPRSLWSDQRVSDGDRIEIIHAVQGG